MKVYGLNAVFAALRARPEAVVRAYIDEAKKVTLGPLMRDLAAHRVAYRVVPSAELERVAASHHHEGACLLVKPKALPTLEAWIERCPAAALAVVLDGVRNPHNLGAVIRTAAHFGARGLWVVGSVSLHGALARVAEGGMEAVDVFSTTSPVTVLRALARAGFAVVGADQTAEISLYSHRYSRRTALVLGAENEGLSESVRSEMEVSVGI
ncbi:MAG: TrmH family RNA methyltransferase, partial [Myxococcota bacterium]